MSAPYRIGDVVVDAARFEVTRAGRRLALEPKALLLLLHLIEHRERVVTRDELLDALWAGTFVTPNALTRVVAQLRRELDDDVREPRFIQTVHRRGYRFVADVSHGDLAKPETPPAPGIGAVSRGLGLALGLVRAALGGVYTR